MPKRQTAPSLYIIASPIGNLRDLSPRAQDTLQEVDWVAAEDTRRTGILLKELGLSKPLHSLHEHSSTKKAEELTAKLVAGEKGAYLSDAGTPGVSDPGDALVRAAVEAGLTVSPIPGPSAVTALLSASGFSGNAFSFKGFFPREMKERRAFCAEIRKHGGIHVFFETPHRISDALDVIAAELPDADFVFGRELTKVFETLVYGKASKAPELLKSQGMEKGEFVLAVSLPIPEEGEAQNALNPAEVFQELADAGASHRVLVALGKALGMPKNDAYSLGLKVLKKDTR